MTLADAPVGVPLYLPNLKWKIQKRSLFPDGNLCHVFLIKTKQAFYISKSTPVKILVRA